MKAKAQSKPIGGLLDKRFQYVRSEHTNIRATFERIKREGSLLIKTVQQPKKENAS